MLTKNINNQIFDHKIRNIAVIANLLMSIFLTNAYINEAALYMLLLVPALLLLNLVAMIDVVGTFWRDKLDLINLMVGLVLCLQLYLLLFSM